MHSFPLPLPLLCFCLGTLSLLCPASALGNAIASAEPMPAIRNMTALRRHLLTDYDDGVPPLGAQVRVQLSLQQIMAVDTARQTVQVMMWLRQYWTDPRLAWDPSKWGGISKVTFKGGSAVDQELWSPDLTVYESLTTTPITASGGDTTLITVTPSGGAFLSVPQVSTMSCRMDMRYFPFDTQTCNFTVGSWTFGGDEVDIKPRVVDGEPSAVSVSPTAIGMAQNTLEFKLIGVTTNHFSKAFSCCPEVWPQITYALTLERVSLTYVTGILVPLFLVTYAGFFAFTTNPKSGERIGLGMTVMLTTAVIYLVASEVLPKTGDWTVVSLVYLVSLVASLLTMGVSMFSVSLYSVHPPEGALTEKNLLKVFVESDKDANVRITADYE